MAERYEQRQSLRDTRTHLGIGYAVLTSAHRSSIKDSASFDATRQALSKRQPFQALRQSPGSNTAPTRAVASFRRLATSLVASRNLNKVRQQDLKCSCFSHQGYQGRGCDA